MARARTCNDCYFRTAGLCALARNEPCPTFRDAKCGTMIQPRQPVLLALTDRGNAVDEAAFA